MLQADELMDVRCADLEADEVIRSRCASWNPSMTPRPFSQIEWGEKCFPIITLQLILLIAFDLTMEPQAISFLVGSGAAEGAIQKIICS